jgi:uncharacterized membrane protein
VWGGTLALVGIGVAAAIGRTVFLPDFVTRAEPLRRQILDGLHREDPFAHERPAELDEVDRRFAAHPVVTLLHVIPGGLFLLLAPLQFVTRVRSRYPDVHRWSGRALLLLAGIVGCTGLYFGLAMPYGGRGEAIAIGVFGGLLLVAATTAFVAIRRRQVARHREWMLRVFAIAIAISTVRLIGAVADVVLTPAGWPPKEVFVFSIWTGWILTLGTAEVWIRHTRSVAH